MRLMREAFFLFVITAKAGISFIYNQIPAFAGMTIKGFLRYGRNDNPNYYLPVTNY